MGVFYRLHPGFDDSRLALAQFGLWIIGSIVHPAGMGLVLRGHMFGGPMIGVGSLQLLVSVLLFGWQVFRGESADAHKRAVVLAPVSGA